MKLQKNGINKVLFSTFLFAVILLHSCDNEERPASKSMDEIHKEQGVPVRILTVQTQEFNLSLNYTVTLEGIKQTTVSSMVNDEIKKFLPKIGNSVIENQVVVEFSVNNPAWQYDKLKESYDNLKKTYEKNNSLPANNETSRQNFENIETQYLVAKKNFESLKKMLFVTAPFPGQIVEKFAEQGQKVKIGDNLFTIAQTDKMKASFWVTEEELVFLKEGMEIEIIDQEKTYKGKISEVALSQDQMRKAFKIDAEFPNPKRELKVGMTVDIKIDSYKNPKAIAIPSSSVIFRNGRNFVFITDGATAIEKEVTLGKFQYDNIEILSGLNSGDNLIYQGFTLLKNGSKVKINQ
jgi:RND family efflux transporter MFP subunit